MQRGAAVADRDRTVHPVPLGQFAFESVPGRALSRLPAKFSTGMLLASAKDSTARRNACPRRSSNAGEGIGRRSWAVRKLTTWPPTTKVGTDSVK